MSPGHGHLPGFNRRNNDDITEPIILLNNLPGLGDGVDWVHFVMGDSIKPQSQIFNFLQGGIMKVAPGLEIRNPFL